MKRIIIIIILLLLCLPLNAWAVRRVLVIDNPNPSNTHDINRQRAQIFQGSFRKRGIEYHFIPHTAAKTSLCATGIYPVATYDAIIHLGFVPGRNSAASGYFPDSLTLRAGWGNIPQLFVGALVAEFAKWNDTATCSTGIRSNEAQFGVRDITYSTYVVGQNEIWNSTNANWHVGALAHTGGAYNGTSAVWRPILGVGANPLALTNGTTNTPGTDNDVIIFGRSAVPDTVVLWARYRSRLDLAPVIFCDIGVNPVLVDIAPLNIALGMLDSLIWARTGERLYTKTFKQNIAIANMFRSGHYNHFSSNDSLTGGIFCRPDSCDQANQFAIRDSFNQKFPEVPLTFLCDVDSIDYANFAWQKILLEGYTNYKVSPVAYASDIWGHSNSRILIPPGTTDIMNMTFPGQEVSIASRLYRADSILIARYGRPKVDRVVHAPFDDFTPKNINRPNASKLDTLLAVIHLAGYRGIVVDPENGDSDAGRTNNPRGWTSGYTKMRVRLGTDPVIGNMYFFPTRGDAYRAINGWYSASGLHNLISEQEYGMNTGMWYAPGGLLLYEHNIFSGDIPIIRLHIIGLGGAGQNRPSHRNSWLTAKWLISKARTENRMAGRVVNTFVKAEELID